MSSAYQIKGAGARLGGSCAEIERVQMLTKSIGSAEEFYGNIGENAFTSFNGFTLDFAAMRFSIDASPRSSDVEP